MRKAIYLFGGAVAVAAVLMASGCTMGRGAFAGLNPFTWLKPSTYVEMHRQHKEREVYEEFQRTNQASRK